MKLKTQQAEIKSRIDRISRMQYDAGSESFIVFFNVSTAIGDEEFGEYFDNAIPVSIPISEIKEALDFFSQKAFEFRAKQIEGKSTTVQHPDYKTFLSELLSLEIFRLAQEQAKSDQVLNVAYTDFSVMLSNAISGVEIISALQASFDAVLKNLVWEGDKKEEYLEPLRDAIAHSNIPLNLPKEE